MSKRFDHSSGSLTRLYDAEVMTSHAARACPQDEMRRDTDVTGRMSARRTHASYDRVVRTSMRRMTSPFLQAPESTWVASNALAFAIRDGFPVTPGHTLVVTKRPIPTWFDATREEQQAILDVIDVVKRDLDAGDPNPDGYNVGFNVGEAAGQTVMHLHVH